MRNFHELMLVLCSEGGINMGNKITTIISVLVAALMISQVSYAAEAFCQNAHFQEGGGRSPGRDGMQRIIHQLNLSEEQQEQLKAQREKHREHIEQMQGYLKQHRRSLKEELESAAADKNRINNIITEMKETEGRLMYLRTVGILETKEILTPEQFEKLQSFHKRTMQQRRNGPQQSRGRQGGGYEQE
jgi:Spy/CpxP family protein refolding chaperone